MLYTNLSSLSDDELTRAHEAADYLLKLPIRRETILSVKLDTLRCDLATALEDRAAPVPFTAR